MRSEVTTPSRRERKLAATKGSIFEAARSLFMERPFDAVTVQQIAERADLGVGTLFYHAPNKVEMFLMVYNVTLEQAIAEGELAEAALSAEADLSSRVLALILPISRLTQSPQAANLARYHRELLFGDSDGPHRREGIRLVRRLEEHMATVLCSPVGYDPHIQLARLAARTVFASLHFDIAVSSTDLDSETRFVSNDQPHFSTQIDAIIRGFTAQVAALSAGRTTPVNPGATAGNLTTFASDTALSQERF